MAAQVFKASARETLAAPKFQRVNAAQAHKGCVRDAIAAWPMASV
jgi:hypothetical protein